MKKIKNILFGVLFFAVFIGFGYIIGTTLPPEVDAYLDSQNFIMVWVLIAAAAMAAVYLATIIHEGGHLIAGLLSGYKFLSFRVMSMVFIKIDGKIKLKFQNIAGTGGQCLLTPPQYSENMPYKFYLLGGVLINTVTGICAVFLLPIITNAFLYLFVSLFALISVVFALINGVPFSGELVQNDGKTLASSIKDETARKALYIQLAFISKITEGTSLLDMPDDWFYIERDKRDAMSSFPTALYINRLIYNKEFERAEEVIEEALRDDLIPGINKYMMVLELLFCKIMTDKEIDDSKIFQKEVNSFIKQMPGNPSIIRILYTYNLLYKKDTEKAEEFYNKFESAAPKHPYAVEVEDERELLEFAKQKAEDSLEIV